jgi:hypothetical protein
MTDVLVIEDIRTFRFDAVYARTLDEARVLLFSKPWDEVWWDHDMGLTKNAPDTYKLACEVERLAYKGAILPIGLMVVHSANPNGGDSLMAAFKKHYPTVRVVANDYLAEGETPMFWTGG